MQNKLDKINLLESIFINEDFQIFMNKRNRALTEEEKIQIKENWYNYSSTFTRMWLNYLSDDKLDRLLQRKLNQHKGINQYNEMFSSS
ncbi:MAG TPA: hypothetical protein PK385_08865 [Spirochaetota bacterium]|jgi:hypothetical protein|nr:MAG: hypothetical protein BWX91_02103 [Spirochaetes bacterium ADurb.Bin133]HNZ26098.1 hypothetical protein [Spirochaetota bacterium]HOF01006.1 hypothetical protein [Spirochaetota bacterium]HOS32795.1 hypothetical protein [Spirochaetota bacterium]HOS56153.1 hypothetical protein [Spirochaetota bacterium]